MSDIDEEQLRREVDEALHGRKRDQGPQVFEQIGRAHV